MKKLLLLAMMVPGISLAQNTIKDNHKTSKKVVNRAKEPSKKIDSQRAFEIEFYFRSQAIKAQRKLEELNNVKRAK